MDNEHFKALLLMQQKSLLDVLESGKSAAGTVKLDQTSVGRLSRMDAMQSQAMLQEASRRREQSLRDISKALKDSNQVITVFAKNAVKKLPRSVCK